MTWRRTTRLVALAVTLFILASCGRVTNHGDGPPTTTSQQVGTVVGVFGTAGGPAPGGFHPLASGIVTLRNRGHVYTTHVTSDGRFSVKAMPGTYQVTGTGPQGNTCDSGTVRVQREKTTSVTVACEVP